MTVDPAKFCNLADLCDTLTARDRAVNSAVECLMTGAGGPTMIRREPARAAGSVVERYADQPGSRRTYIAPDVTGSLDCAARLFNRAGLDAPALIPSTPAKVAALALRAIAARAACQRLLDGLGEAAA